MLGISVYQWVDAVAIGLVALKLIVTATAVVFFISGLDDLFIDLCYIVRTGWVRLFRRERPPSEAEILAEPEKPIAVMLPAWDESAVIRPMLMNAVRNIQYRNFHIFVGTYPNDTATHREVEIARESFDNIHRIVTPHDGPTNKADCLNWIFHGIKLYEKEYGVEFQIFVMQDCEDVIHPLCYKLFNYAIPGVDMVQLPVHSLKRKWYEFTGGHYLDEFAQLHTKDLTVRQMLSRSIPGAGVGLGFSRRGLETFAAHNDNEVFSIDSLTEDYDFGCRMKDYGLRQAFIRYWVRRPLPAGSWLRRLGRQYEKELVCVKEFFPGGFQASVRQKSRWVVGIVFQGWEHLGWRGGVGTRYVLFRDRKALLTNFINLVGYFVVAVVLAELAIPALFPEEAYRYPPLVERGTMLWYLIIGNAQLFMARIAIRAWCVLQVHDLTQAVLSVPRMAWGNFINFFATWRAVRLYWRYLRTGKLIAWDKTAHVYPSESELAVFRPRLGDRLLERCFITATALDEALLRQARDQRRLGQILLDMGAVSAADLEAVLAEAQ